MLRNVQMAREIRNVNGCICCRDKQIHVSVFLAVIFETVSGDKPDQSSCALAIFGDSLLHGHSEVTNNDSFMYPLDVALLCISSSSWAHEKS